MGEGKKKKHGMHWLLALVLSFVISILLGAACMSVVGTGTFGTLIANILGIAAWILLTGFRYGTNSTWFNCTLWLFGVARAVMMVFGSYNASIFGGQSMAGPVAAAVAYLLAVLLLCKKGQSMGENAAAQDIMDEALTAKEGNAPANKNDNTH